eukprot:gene17886-biopygen8366
MGSGSRRRRCGLGVDAAQAWRGHGAGRARAGRGLVVLAASGCERHPGHPGWALGTYPSALTHAYPRISTNPHAKRQMGGGVAGPVRATPKHVRATPPPAPHPNSDSSPPNHGKKSLPICQPGNTMSEPGAAGFYYPLWAATRISRAAQIRYDQTQRGAAKRREGVRGGNTYCFRHTSLVNKVGAGGEESVLPSVSLRKGQMNICGEGLLDELSCGRCTDGKPEFGGGREVTTPKWGWASRVALSRCLRRHQLRARGGILRHDLGLRSMLHPHQARATTALAREKPAPRPRSGPLGPSLSPLHFKKLARRGTPPVGIGRHWPPPSNQDRTKGGTQWWQSPKLAVVAPTQTIWGGGGRKGDPELKNLAPGPWRSGRLAQRAPGAAGPWRSGPLAQRAPGAAGSWCSGLLAQRAPGAARLVQRAPGAAGIWCSGLLAQQAPGAAGSCLEQRAPGAVGSRSSGLLAQRAPGAAGSWRSGLLACDVADFIEVRVVESSPPSRGGGDEKELLRASGPHHIKHPPASNEPHENHETREENTESGAPPYRGPPPCCSWMIPVASLQMWYNHSPLCMVAAAGISSRPS